MRLLALSRYWQMSRRPDSWQQRCDAARRACVGASSVGSRRPQPGQASTAALAVIPPRTCRGLAGVAGREELARVEAVRLDDRAAAWVEPLSRGPTSVARRPTEEELRV